MNYICTCPQCQGLDEAPFRICEDCGCSGDLCECEYREDVCSTGFHCMHDDCVNGHHTCCYCGYEFEE